MISAVLLAAGKSERMGRLKALLPWGDRTLIEVQMEQIARSGIGECIVVLGYRYERLFPVVTDAAERLKCDCKFAIIRNDRYETGKTTSIKAGISALSPQSRGVFVVGVDQPVRMSTIQRMLDEWEDEIILLPMYRGKKGHPPFFSSRLYSELLKIREETKGLREILQRHQLYVRCVETDDPAVTWNLNTMEDYQAALEERLDV